MPIVITEDRIEQVYFFFRNLAEKQHRKHPHRKYGIVEFAYQEMVDSKETFMERTSYVSQIMLHLMENGFASRIRRGGAINPSIWDVSPFLGYGKVKYEKPEVEIEVVQSSKTNNTREEVKDVPKESENNTIVLSELNQSIQDMNSHLKELPLQMGTYLRDISAQLKLLDGSVLEELQKENNQLTATIKELEAKIEELNQDDYNKEKVERQCELLEDKINDIFAAPWKIGKHKDSYKQAIGMRLQNIKRELGIVE